MALPTGLVDLQPPKTGIRSDFFGFMSKYVPSKKISYVFGGLLLLISIVIVLVLKSHFQYTVRTEIDTKVRTDYSLKIGDPKKEFSHQEIDMLQPPKVKILEPKDNQPVTYRVPVRGQLNGKGTLVIAVKATNGVYYIQPSASLTDDGRFKTTIYCGGENIGMGENFEISAWLLPSPDLKEPMQLNQIPDHVLAKDVIDVVRK
jgi:hypothetical protein